MLLAEEDAGPMQLTDRIMDWHDRNAAVDADSGWDSDLSQYEDSVTTDVPDDQSCASSGYQEGPVDGDVFKLALGKLFNHKI